MRKFGYSLALLTSASIATSALAQEQQPPLQNGAANDAVGTGEIVVTAQKRNQLLTDVGLSITAVSGDALTAQGVATTADLVKVVPGLTFTPTPYNTPVYTLRGMGYFDNALASSPAVSVYVDEVPLSFPAMTVGTTLDLERVEVLKGPQGTLYGQNSTGGAINFIAAKPTDRLKSGFDVSFGRFSALDASGFISGPLTSTLRARVAVRAQQSGDWQKSYTRDDTLGKTDLLMGRILLDWTPSDSIKVAVNVNAWRDKSDTLAGQLIRIQPTDPVNVSPDLINNATGYRYPLSPNNARAADWDDDFPMSIDDDFYEGSLRADIGLTDNLTLTSISSYQRYRQDKFNDLDATSTRNVHFHNFGTIKTFNQEFRLTGESDRIVWLAGGNYSWADITDSQEFISRDVSVNGPIPGLPRFTSVAPTGETKINNYAAFGNIDLKLTERLTVIAGLRFTQANRDYYACARVTDPNLGRIFEAIQGGLIAAGVKNNPVVPINQGDCYSLDANFNPSDFTGRLREDSLSIRAGINYKTDGGTLLYASFNRGYKSGNFPISTATTTSQFDAVKQERVLAYEAGIKTAFANRRVRVAMAGFVYDYADKQIRGRVRDPIFGPQEQLVNIPRSRVLGAEIEIQAEPIPGLQLSAAATYVDSKILEFIGFNQSLALENYRGSSFPNTPELQIVGDAQYTFNVSDKYELFLGAGLRHNSVANATFGDEALLRIRPYTLLDLRAGVQSADGQWRFSVWGRNVTDVYHWNAVFTSTDTVFRQAARPATYGASLSFRFN